MKEANKKLSLNTEQIAEIVDEFEIGNCCYIHRQTGALLFTPDFEMYDEAKVFFEIEFLELKNNADNYIQIEKPRSKESFVMIENFTNQLNDRNELKNKLLNALNNNKPFKNFKYLIDNADEEREQWFSFRTQELKNWVKEKLDEIILNEIQNSDN